MTGDLDGADAAVAEAGAVFDAVRHRAGASLAETLAANLALLHGDLDAAEERGRRAHELFRVSQYFLALPILFSVLAETRALRDDARGANEAVQGWQATGQQGSQLVQLMLEARSQPDAVREHAGQHTDLLAFITIPSVLAPSMCAIAAEVAYATLNADLAGRVLGNIDRFPDSEVVLGPGFPYTVSRSRALALEARGDTDAALESLRRALDVAEDVRVPLEVARARVAIARLIAGDQPTEAALHAEAASAIAERHGFVAVARAAKAAIAR
jgi:hypothetical protein